MNCALGNIFPSSPAALGDAGDGGGKTTSPPQYPWGVGGGGVEAGARNCTGENAAKAGVLAIDIGRTGALALFVGGDLVDIADMPTLDDGPAGRPTINGPLLAALIGRWAPAAAVCEHVAARPGEAPSGAFAFGRSRGVIEGVLAAQGIPVRFVTPAWWKRRAGIPAGRDHKDTARSIAIGRWPSRAEMFARKLDQDRAEAALIGIAHLQEKQR